MSISTFVHGIVTADDRWVQMKKIWDACKAANVEPPASVLSFFGGEEPDSKGVLIDLEEAGVVERWTDGYREGWDVDLSRLPKHVQLVRFVHSW